VIKARWFKKNEFPANKLLECLGDDPLRHVIDVVKVYYRGTYLFAFRGFAGEDEDSFGEWYLPDEGVGRKPWVVDKIGKEVDEEMYSYFCIPENLQKLSANILERFSMGSNKVLGMNDAGQITCEGVFKDETLLHSHEYSYDSKSRLTEHVLKDCSALPVINVFCGRREWEYSSLPLGVIPNERTASLLASLAFEWLPVLPSTATAYYLCGVAKAYDLAGDLYREFHNLYDEQGKIIATEYWQETYQGMKHFASSRYDYSVAGKILKYWYEPPNCLEMTTTIVLDEKGLPISQTEVFVFKKEDEEPGGYPAAWDEGTYNEEDGIVNPLVRDRTEPYYTERTTCSEACSVREVRTRKV